MIKAWPALAVVGMSVLSVVISELCGVLEIPTVPAEVNDRFRRDGQALSEGELARRSRAEGR
jgi:hypothetical protein